MTTMKEAAQTFLALKRIAVAGVSRTDGNAANVIYRKLRSDGYEVSAVNPNAKFLEGDVCYPDLRSIPEIPEGVVIVTRPEATEAIVRECAELAIANVWMHNGMHALGTSISEDAVAFCRTNQITAIPGGCPMMFFTDADFGHRLMRWIQEIAGKMPREI